MINTAELLKLLSTNYTKYTKHNVKISIKLDGKFNNGNDKYQATVKNSSDVVIYQGMACLTKDKDLLFDEKPLYKVDYIIEA